MQRVNEWVQVHQRKRGQPDPPFWAQIVRKFNMHIDVQAPGHEIARVNRAACSQESYRSIPT